MDGGIGWQEACVGDRGGGSPGAPAGKYANWSYARNGGYRQP